MNALEQQIRRRAGDACEYCQFPQAGFRARFPIDHVIARQHGGQTVPENLALCCPRCNRYKGPNIAGLDPLTGQLTRLFRPREDRWPDHFAWRGAHLVGITAIGRTTIAVLSINHASNVAVREQLILEAVFQPSDPSAGRNDGAG